MSAIIAAIALVFIPIAALWLIGWAVILGIGAYYYFRSKP